MTTHGEIAYMYGTQSSMQKRGYIKLFKEQHWLNSIITSEFKQLVPAHKQHIRTIHYVLSYGHFCCKLYKDEGLCKNSVKFKIHQILHNLSAH